MPAAWVKHKCFTLIIQIFQPCLFSSICDFFPLPSPLSVGELSGSPEDSSHIPSMRTWSLVLVGQRWPYSSSIVYICYELRATWRTDTRHSSLFCLMTTQLRMEKWQESLENIIKLTTCSPLGQMITINVYINYLKP